jgi:hypothetical protein
VNECLVTHPPHVNKFLPKNAQEHVDYSGHMEGGDIARWAMAHGPESFFVRGRRGDLQRPVATPGDTLSLASQSKFHCMRQQGIVGSVHAGDGTVMHTHHEILHGAIEKGLPPRQKAPPIGGYVSKMSGRAHCRALLTLT